jgi:hypothetical protein
MNRLGALLVVTVGGHGRPRGIGAERGQSIFGAVSRPRVRTVARVIGQAVEVAQSDRHIAWLPGRGIETG